MHKHFQIILLISFGLLLACNTGLDQNLLLGKWKGSALYENKNLSDTDVSHVEFDFKENEQYFYRGTLKYTEAGRFYTVGNTLYSTDTTRTEKIEKSVRVIRLSADSLFLQMNSNGTPQLLQLYKVK